MLLTSGVQALCLTCCAVLIIPAPALGAQGGSKKPSLSLRANPPISFAPARIVVVAEVKGGPDDFEDFYCPVVEWEWGDGTTSVAEADCLPYEPGKSQIKRRYTMERQFRNEGGFRIQVRFKKGDRVTALAATSIQVRPGVGPGGPG